MLPPPSILIDINNQEILEIVKRECPRASLFLSDSFYKTTTLSELIRFLKDDKTNEYRYVSEYMDCDDFSFHLMGSIHCIEWGALPFGIMWAQTPAGGHAINCFVDDKKEFWVIEPQNDQVKKLPSDWLPYLVII